MPLYYLSMTRRVHDYMVDAIALLFLQVGDVVLLCNRRPCALACWFLPYAHPRSQVPLEAAGGGGGAGICDGQHLVSGHVLEPVRAAARRGALPGHASCCRRGRISLSTIVVIRICAVVHSFSACSEWLRTGAQAQPCPMPHMLKFPAAVH